MTIFTRSSAPQAAPAAVAPVMPEPTFTASLQAAIQSTARAVQEQAKVEQALAAARGSVLHAERDLQQAQERLSVAEAGAAVGDADVDRGARKRLVSCRDELDFCRARLAGLEDRLKTVAATTNEERRKLATEFRNWQRDQAERVMEQFYKPALATLLDAMRVLTAAGAALSVNRLVAVARQSVVPDPADPSRDLSNPKRLAWRDDPTAKALYGRLLALRAEVEPLLGEYGDKPVVVEEGTDHAA